MEVPSTWKQEPLMMALHSEKGDRTQLGVAGSRAHSKLMGAEGSLVSQILIHDALFLPRSPLRFYNSSLLFADLKGTMIKRYSPPHPHVLFSYPPSTSLWEGGSTGLRGKRNVCRLGILGPGFV